MISTIARTEYKRVILLKIQQNSLRRVGIGQSGKRTHLTNWDPYVGGGGLQSEPWHSLRIVRSRMRTCEHSRISGRFVTQSNVLGRLARLHYLSLYLQTCCRVINIGRASYVCIWHLHTVQRSPARNVIITTDLSVLLKLISGKHTELKIKIIW